MYVMLKTEIWYINLLLTNTQFIFSLFQNKTSLSISPQPTCIAVRHLYFNTNSLTQIAISIEKL